MALGRTSLDTGSGPPKAPSPTPTNGPNTRRTICTPTSLEEIIATPNSVMDTDSAEKFLTSKLLCQQDQPYTLTHLTPILFHITQMSSVTPVPVNAAIRAVAFLLKKHIACDIADAAAKHLTDTLSKALSESLTSRLVDHTVAALAPQIASVHAASEALAKTARKAEEELASSLDKAERIHRIARDERKEQEGGLSVAAERIEEAADALYASVADCQNTVNLLTPSLEVTQERINLLSTQMQSTLPAIQNSTSAPQSYSAIVTAHLPPKANQAIGRAAIRARQIILDPKPDSTPFPPGSSNKDIANRLKEALTNIRDDNTPTGDIKAITTLNNGGLVVELDSEELAAWLRNPMGRTLFENQFNSTVSFRSRTFALVLEYLPIQLQIDNESFLQRVEIENQLPAGSLSTIRWIKPPTRRSREQRKAFALLQVTDAPTANNILRDGLCIDNERIIVRKDKKEPIRCAKCQRYGHIARNCSDPSDTCGTCAEQHRTDNCNAFRTTRCTNCRSIDHTSWSRKCPEFIRRCDILDEKFPENKMPYFPTEAAWTHAISPPRPPKIVTPLNTPRRPLHSHRTPPLHIADTNAKTTHVLRQTTLTSPRTAPLPNRNLNPPPTPSISPPTRPSTPNPTQAVMEATRAVSPPPNPRPSSSTPDSPPTTPIHV